MSRSIKELLKVGTYHMTEAEKVEVCKHFNALLNIDDEYDTGSAFKSLSTYFMCIYDINAEHADEMTQNTLINASSLCDLIADMFYRLCGFC